MLLKIRPNERSVLPRVCHAPNENVVRDIRRWSWNAARALGIPGLPLVVTFSFTRLPADLAGRAGLDGLIQLNRKEWGKLTRRAQKDIVVHELCHVVELVRYGCTSSHGQLFWRLMRRAGMKEAA